MAIQRDEKGRFLKGNTQGFSTENARERQLQSREVLKRNTKERKTLAEALRLILNEEVADGVTKQEAIIARVIKRVYDRGNTKDLVNLAQLLGEYKQNININTEEAGMLIRFTHDGDKTE